MKRKDLKEIIRECIRSFVTEMEGWEPYDDVTGDIAPAPRDRTEPVQPEVEPVAEPLGIPEFPQAVIKGHLRHGAKKYFVYSDNTPEALIIGYSKDKEDAIHNAKTTAGYIKRGGVGHTGEIKEEGEQPINQEKMKMLNDILVTCQYMEKKVHVLTDENIRFGIKHVKETVLELMKMEGVK